VALTTPDPNEGETEHSWPQLLPGGEAVLFTVGFGGSWDDAQIVVENIENRERRILIEGGTHARYVPTGHLVYSRTGTLTAVPFDLARLEVTGSPVPVVEGVIQARGSGVAQFALSDLGSLIYIQIPGSVLHEHSLVWVDQNGTETPVTQEEKDYRVPRVSPDGQFFSVTVGDPVTNQLWIYDLEAESLSRLTFEEERSGSAVWSPDSKWLVFQSGRRGEGGLVRQPADRSLPQERLTSTTTGRQMPNSWSSDGRFVAFTETEGQSDADIGILPMEGEGEVQFIVASSAMECCPKFSPDGKWLAYVSDELGQNNVYIRPFPEPDVKWLISEEGVGSGQPVWSPDGRELFYRSGDKTIVVSIQTQDQTLSAGSPEVLFEGQYVSHSQPPGLQYYDISPDGKRFLMLKEETVQEQAQINLVLNWFEELKRLVPTDN
jgi:dipeptidyl aminopeptidase/acylaminoacyl peptidase